MSTDLGLVATALLAAAARARAPCQWNSPALVSAPRGGKNGVLLKRSWWAGTKMCSIHGRFAGGTNEKKLAFVTRRERSALAEISANLL